ncbi:hypothetical protein Nepgr_022564 [Nepenthes gracilis]|uniref:Uncharacterized protein n=1 Tax=Nepenthes gracilis TaxID=150966 RepID=A0AAD3T164_NEPGR|nr:hypothetical protein Nepgr_022564 [Nepenthes gracilis]
MGMVIPDAHGRVYSPPDDFVTIYKVHLKCGLQYLIPLEFYGIMRDLKVSVARLQPNTVRYLVSLYIFACYHEKLLDSMAVKVILRFSHSQDWIIVTPCPEFLWGNVESKFYEDVTTKERAMGKNFTDLLLANLGSFNENKKNKWLRSEFLVQAKRKNQPNDSGARCAPSKKKKLKKKW